MGTPFTERANIARAENAVPTSALAMVNASLGEAIGDLSSTPFPSGRDGNTSVMRSFRGNDHETRTRFDSPRMVGVYGYVDGLHQATRMHVTQIHKRYKNQVLETLSALPWTEVAVPELQSAAHGCGELDKAAATLPEAQVQKLRRATGEMKQAVEEGLVPNPNRGAKAKIYWALGSLTAELHHILQREDLDKGAKDELRKWRKHVDSHVKVALNRGGIHLLEEDSAPFTLLNNKGEPIMLSNGKPATANVSCILPEDTTLIDYVVGAIGGQGALNLKYSETYQQMTTKLIGNASNTLGLLRYAYEAHADALIKAHPDVPSDEIHAALSEGGINFTPLMWQSMRNIAERALPEMTYHSHVNRLCQNKSDEVLGRYTQALANKMGLSVPAVETLRPTTRMDYLGLLHALDVRRESVTVMFGNRESSALEQTIERAKAMLAPSADELQALEDTTIPNFHIGSPAQQRPTEAMRTALQEVVNAANIFIPSRKKPMPAADMLNDMIKKGLEAPNVAVAPRGQSASGR